MRYLIAVCVLCVASVAQAERVKVCGPRGCYFVERSTVGANVATVATEVKVATRHVAAAPARAVRQWRRVRPVQRTVIRVRTGRLLRWWR